MPESGARARDWAADLRIATAFLTRFPVRTRAEAARGALGKAGWAFPLIGIGVGLAGGAVFTIASWLGLTVWLAALFAVAAQVWLTGALHEDALGDVADGFGGGGDRQAKLAIMRDSRVGTFGVIALVLAFAARIAALAALEEAGAVLAALVAAGAVSRAGMVWLMRCLPLAREDGLAHRAGVPDNDTTAVATIIALAAAASASGIAGAVVVAVGAAFGLAAIARLALRQIGGQTGDVLGTGQQTAEILCLCALVAIK